MLKCSIITIVVVVCFVVISVIRGYKNIGAFCFIIFVVHCEYNLKFKLLSLCAGICTTFALKVCNHLITNFKRVNNLKTVSVSCSTTSTMQGHESSGIFRSDSMLSPIPKVDKSVVANGFNNYRSPKVFNSTLRLGHMSRYSLSEDAGTSHFSNCKIMDTNPKLRSRAAGIKTTQTVAGPLLASTRHKIDQNLYVDVNSPGLTMRIVQYNETSNEERPTIEPRYKGVGQFPIVHLNKTQPQQIPIKKSAVKIKIAPPDVSSYASDHRMHMLTTEQHRPLLPLPIHESSGSPTKSVLDALKEISRKRIHSQDDSEYNYTEDISKRQRKESLSRCIGPTPFSRPSISKRPRDEESREFVDSTLFTRLNAHENGYKCWRPKKRQRNDAIKCNDILSSLSSSRHLQRENSKRKAELSPKDDVKQMRLTMENVSRISIPAVDIGKEDAEILYFAPGSKSELSKISSSSSDIKSKGSSRITLFNKVFPSNSNKSSESLIEDNDGYEKMSFVKPRKQTAKNLSGSLNYTERCKLSQMLSCLSDENSVGEFNMPAKATLLSNDVDKNPGNMQMTASVNSESSLKLPVIPSTRLKSTIVTSFETFTTASISLTVGNTTNTIVSTLSENSSNESISMPKQVSKASNSVEESTIEPNSIVVFGNESPNLNKDSELKLPESTSNTQKPNSNERNSATPNKTFIDISKPSEASSTPNSNTFLFGVPATQKTNTTSAVASKPTASIGTETFNTPTEGGFYFDLKKSTSQSTSPGSSPLSITTASNKTASERLAFTSQSLTNKDSEKLTNSSDTSIPCTVTTQNQSIFGNKNTLLFSPSAAVSTSPAVTSVNSNICSTFAFGTNVTPFANVEKSEINSQISAINSDLSNNTSTLNSAPLPTFGSNKSIKSNAINDNINNTSGNGTLFNATTKASVTPSNLVFGSTNTPEKILFGTTTAPNTNTISFGALKDNNASSANSNIATATISFGSSTNKASVFGTSTSAPVFGSSTIKSVFGTSKTTTPAFGVANPSNTFSSTTTFSNTATFATTTTSASIFGSTSSKETSFGTPVASTQSFGNPSAATLSFGVPVTSSPCFGASITSTPSFGVPVTSTPSFGVPVTSTPSFGVPVTSTPSFGVTVASTPSFGVPVTTTPSFGVPVTSTLPFGVAPTTTASFGISTTSTPAFSISQGSFGAAAAPTTSFGVASTTAPSFGITATTTPSFGIAATTAPSFGISTSTLFGTNTATTLPAQSNIAPSVFGATSPSAPNISTNKFGNLNNSSFGGLGATFGTKAAPSFGIPNANTNIFGNNPKESNSNATFGTTNTPTGVKNVFTFGNSNSVQAATPFNFNAQPSVTKTFNFGSNTPAPNFGSNTVTPNFTVGSPQPNLFGSPVSAPGAAPTFGSPASSFGANSSGSMFSIGAGGGPKSRVRTRRQMR